MGDAKPHGLYMAREVGWAATAEEDPHKVAHTGQASTAPQAAGHVAAAPEPKECAQQCCARDQAKDPVGDQGTPTLSAPQQ